MSVPENDPVRVRVHVSVDVPENPRCHHQEWTFRETDYWMHGDREFSVSSCLEVEPSTYLLTRSRRYLQ